ncbi:MAG TPA: hypothetical protein VJX67_11355 [Blastocatellia bacterium]|nr:hypothetical protein [Blastocatellia bacterium]
MTTLNRTTPRILVALFVLFGPSLSWPVPSYSMRHPHHQAAQRPKRPGIPAVQVPLSSLAIRAGISVPGGPDWLAAAFGSMWVSNSPRNSVSRIDPASNRVLATISVGQDPCLGIGVGLGSVWIPNCKDKTLSRIDPRTNKVVRTFPINIDGEGEGAIATGYHSIWLLTNDAGTDSGTLSRIDPLTGKTVAMIPVCPKSNVAVTGYGAVWVTGTGCNTVFRIDPRANVVDARIPVGPTPRFTAAGGNGVWVLNQGDGTVSRIDPRTNKVVATIEVGVPGAGGDIAVGAHSIWVSADGLPVSEINPRSNKVVRQYAGGGGADAIRIGFGSAWVSDHRKGEVWRIGIPRKR